MKFELLYRKGGPFVQDGGGALKVANCSPGISREIQEYLGISRNIQENPGISREIQEYQGTSRKIQEHQGKDVP